VGRLGGKGGGRGGRGGARRSTELARDLRSILIPISI